MERLELREETPDQEEGRLYAELTSLTAKMSEEERTEKGTRLQTLQARRKLKPMTSFPLKPLVEDATVQQTQDEYTLSLKQRFERMYPNHA
jgi:hypothetical protein